MITLLSLFLILSVIFGIIKFSLKLTWGLLKIALLVIVIPIVVVALFAVGLAYIALPFLVFAGFMYIIGNLVTQ